MNQSNLIVIFSVTIVGFVLVLGAPTDFVTTESSLDFNETDSDNSTIFGNSTLLTNLTEIDIAVQCGSGGQALEGTPATDKYADVAAWFKDIETRTKTLDDLAKSDAADDASTRRTKEAALRNLSASKQKVVKYQPPLTKTFKTSDAPKMRAIENDLNAAGKALQGVAYKQVICGLGGVAMAWCGSTK